MHAKSQGEDANQEISDGLGEPEQGDANVGDGLDQHQEDNADHPGDGDGQGFGSPQHHRQGHYRQGRAIPVRLGPRVLALTERPQIPLETRTETPILPKPSFS